MLVNSWNPVSDVKNTSEIVDKFHDDGLLRNATATANSQEGPAACGIDHLQKSC